MHLGEERGGVNIYGSAWRPWLGLGSHCTGHYTKTKETIPVLKPLESKEIKFLKPYNLHKEDYFLEE